MKNTSFVSLALTLSLPIPSLAGPLELTGVNLAGAEFGHHNALPGTHGKDYGYPTPAEVDYFVSKGVNVFRLPFAWERLQRKAMADFDKDEWGRLDGFVKYATGKGARVILDPHNYARYYGKVIGADPAAPSAAFADLWTRLAAAYRDNPRVVFGLINEPHTLPKTELWVDVANEAIAAIRRAGAKNLILVPGNGWSGAHSWLMSYYGTPNGTALLKITDPADNYAFDVHQYLDTDSSGTKDVVVSPTIGAERLKAFTEWCKLHKKKAFLGEFGVPNARVGDGPEQTGDEAVENMLAYMEANPDVWLGFAWWAAGPRWGEYMFTLHPAHFGKPDQADRPAMRVLSPHLQPAGSQPPLKPATRDTTGTP